MDTRRRGNGHGTGISRLLSRVAVVGTVAVFTVAAYAFLHEGGHAIAGLLFGGTLTDFSINFWDFSAHVGLEGTFTDLQRSLISLAGVGLPLLIWVALVALGPDRIDPDAAKANATLTWLRLVGSLGIVNTLLAWLVIPVLYLSGQAPPDDVTTFLERSQLPPLLVTATALAVYVACWALLFARSGGLSAVVATVRFAHQTPLSPASLRTLRNLVVAGAGMALVTLALNAYLGQPGAPGVPAGYEQVAVVDLQRGPYVDDPVYRFAVDRPERASFYILLRDVDSGPVEVALLTPAGERQVFLRGGAEFNAGRATVHPKGVSLAPGTYELSLTVPRAPGRVSVYINREAE